MQNPDAGAAKLAAPLANPSSYFDVSFNAQSNTAYHLWVRGKGTTNENLKDGTKVTVFFRKPQLRETGVLPKGGIARFYGVATIYKSGPVYEEIWSRLIQPEKDRDPEKKGFGVLITIERAEDLGGAPLG